MNNLLLILMTLISFTQVQSGELKNTKMLLMLQRHGARKSFTEIKTSQEPLELTQNGFRMAYLLGKYLRKKYSHFFPKKLNFDNNYIITSTPSRCRLSAQAVMLGIYDFNSLDDPIELTIDFWKPEWIGVVPEVDFSSVLPKGFIPIPIHSLEVEENFLFGSFAGQTCMLSEFKVKKGNPRKSKALIAAINLFAKKLVTNKFDYKSISKKEVIETLADFIDVPDYIVTRRYQGDDLGISEEVYQEMLRFKVSIIMDYFFHDSDMAKYIYTELAFELIKHLESALEILEEGKELNKFVLLSGHDLNILSLFLATGYLKNDCIKKDGECTLNPPYSSSLIFEVYEKDKQFLVESVLNGKVIELCKGEKGGNCTLKGFIEYLKNFAFSGKIEDLRNQFCHLNEKSSSSMIKALIGFNVGILAVVSLLIARKVKNLV